MTPGRGPRVCLIVIFLVLIGMVAPSQVVLDLRQGETPGIVDLFRQAPTRANLKRLENDLENKCRLAQAVRPTVQYARFALLHDAGDQALLGRDGWFFYRPAVQYLVEPVRSVPVRAYPQTPHGVTTNDIFTAIVSFRDDLAKRGIKLLVMPAPNKSSVYPQMLALRAEATNPVNPTSREVIAKLKQAGVEVVDLFEVYAPVRSVPVRAYPETSPAVPTNENDIFTAIVSFRDDLAKRGIKLLVMPAPNKSSIYPDMLTVRADSTGSTPALGGEIGEPSRGRLGYMNSTTREVLTALKQAGVEVVDLFEAYARVRGAPVRAYPETSPGVTANYYLAQDSHWSPEGMRLAARAVARRLLDLGWIEKGAVNYDIKPVTIKRYGDVLGMIRVPQVERLYEPEQIDCTQVVNAETGKPYLDDPNSPVLVLGDSFLRIFERDEPGSGGFIAHLAHNLGFGLTSIVNDGGASTLVRQQLARRPALLKGKKVVVWEFVERDIRFGTEGWQVIPIP